MNARPGSRDAAPASRRGGQPGQPDGPRDQGERGERPAPRRPNAPSRRPAAPPTPPRRQPVNRTKVIFAVVGLVVVFSLVIGTVLYGLDAQGIGDTDAGQDPASSGGQANLVPTYEARLRANPDDLDAMLLLANILQNRGDYAGAIAQYNRAVELRPDDLRIRLAFGQALANYGQRSDAEAQYKRALELDPNSPEAEYSLGQLYVRWDPPRSEEARQHYTRASELQPEGSWGRAAREALDRLNATPTR